MSIATWLSRRNEVADHGGLEPVGDDQSCAERGFRMEPAVKGRDSVEEGITFLQSYTNYVHPRCRHTSEELTCYSWKIDKQTGAILPKLADDNNHVIDALRYALEGVRRAESGEFEVWSAGRRQALAVFDHEAPRFGSAEAGSYGHSRVGFGFVASSRRGLAY